MDSLKTYLSNLQNKIFKLLPMKEAHNAGENIHLSEYLINLCSNFDGAFAFYPELSEVREIVEVRNNVEFLKNEIDLDFKRWRAIVLRSTRLVHDTLERYMKEV